jgi:hypothetical protein
MATAPINNSLNLTKENKKNVKNVFVIEIKNFLISAENDAPEKD